MKKMYIGLMSGTSLDGVDAVIADFSSGIKVISTNFIAYPDDLRKEILAIINAKQAPLLKIGELHIKLGKIYADAVWQILDKAKLSPEDIIAIACHGQTIYHHPEGDYPFSWQLGDANTIAAQCKIMTISDFRNKDIAYGGQGAPLVPAFHKAVYEEKILSGIYDTVIVLNLGGIANITVLEKNKPVIGYDCSVANLLMDYWTERHTGYKYDKDGAFAKSGNLLNNLLEKMLKEDEYLQKPAPKSTGREYYNSSWLEKFLLGQKFDPKDVARTLLEFSVQAISQEIRKFAGKNNLLSLCGGGAKNSFFIQRIKENLDNWQIVNSDSDGIDSDFMEALAFAWLAYRRVEKQTGNLKEVTNAKENTILGAVWR